MSYKQLLLSRASAIRDAETEPSPMDYLAFRNHQAMRAWQARRRGGECEPPRTARHWLTSWLHPELPRGI